MSFGRIVTKVWHALAARVQEFGISQVSPPRHANRQVTGSIQIANSACVRVHMPLDFSKRREPTMPEPHRKRGEKLVPIRMDELPWLNG